MSEKILALGIGNSHFGAIRTEEKTHFLLTSPTTFLESTEYHNESILRLLIGF